MSTKDRIELRLEAGQWITRTTGPGAAELFDLFGTADLPTPYTSLSPAGRVLAEIQRLNPNAIVTLAT